MIKHLRFKCAPRHPGCEPVTRLGLAGRLDDTAIRPECNTIPALQNRKRVYAFQLGLQPRQGHGLDVTPGLHGPGEPPIELVHPLLFLAQAVFSLALKVRTQAFNPFQDTPHQVTGFTEHVAATGGQEPMF